MSKSATKKVKNKKSQLIAKESIQSYKSVVYDINESQIKRTCEFFVAEPSIITCTDILRKFKYVAHKNRTDKRIKSISPDDINEIIYKYRTDERSQRFRYAPVMNKILEEANKDSNDNIMKFSANFLAKFIQIVAIYYMYYDYELCKEEMIENLKEDKEEPYEVISTETKLSPRCDFVKRIKLKPEETPEEIIVEDKHMIFVINNFYNVDLLKELIDLNLPLKCVIEVSNSNVGFERQCKCFHMRNLDEDVDLETRIIDYWLRMYDLFEGNVHNEYLEEIFHTQYTPKDLKRTVKHTVEFTKQCEEIYDEFASYLDTISHIETLYTSYINSMLNVDLGRCFKIESSSLKVYKNFLDVLPPECVTIGVIMEALLLEVVKQVPEDILLQSEDVTSIKQYECNDLRDEIRRLFTYNKNKYCHKNHSTSSNEEYLDKETFEVHEANNFQLTFRPYKLIRNDLLDMNVRYMRDIFPFSLWKMRRETGLLENYVRTYDETIPNLLGLTNEGFDDCLNLIKIKEMYKERIEIDECDIQQIFPPNRHKIIYYEFDIRPIYNIYEHLDLSEFNYKESLSDIVLMQKLLKDIDLYVKLDHLYCQHSNSFVIKLHDDCDNFGCCTNDWNQEIATYVCLRDFCKYVINDNPKWMTKTLEDHYERIAMLADLIANRPNPVYMFDRSIFNDFDYILKGSLKDKIRQEELKNKQNEAPTPAKEEIKSKKDKKQKQPKKDDKTAKTMAKKPVNVIDNPLASYDKLVDEVEDSLKTKERRPAKKGEPYEFVGYDISSRRIQLTGNTTTFQSLDGLRAIVDTTNFIGEMAKISVKLSANNHHLYFHTNNLPLSKSFVADEQKIKNSAISFAQNVNYNVHFVLEDNVVVSFSKPLILSDKQENIEENRSRREQTVYYVTESKKSTLNCFNVEYTRKKSYLIPQSEWKRYKERLEYLGNRKYSKKLRTQSSTSTKIRPCTNNMQTHQLDENVSSSSTLQDTNMLKQRFLEDLRYAKENYLPMFKVCSSKLHRDTYLKRVKSYLTIPFNGVLSRIQYKPKLKTKNLTIEAKKCFLIENKEIDETKVPLYKINLSLPSSLCLSNEADENRYYIKQYYIKNNPLNKKISDEEEMRLFYPNGYVVIKKRNGNTIIFINNGDTIYLDCPFLKRPKPKDVNTSQSKDTKPKCKTQHNKCKKAMKEILRRRLKHMIDGPEAYVQKTRNLYKKNLKRYFLPNRHYYFETSGKYTIIKSDGKMIRNINGRYTRENRYYVMKDSAFEDFETVYQREDGTRILFLKDGSQHVQFNDGTRIHTYVQMKYYEDVLNQDDSNQYLRRNICCVPNEYDEDIDVKAFVDDVCVEECKCKLDDDNISEPYDIVRDWVIIDIIYEFNHPNYATVRMGSIRDYMKIVLPNNSYIKTSHDTINFHLDDIVEANLCKHFVTLQSTICKNCNKGAKAMINLLPFYKNTTITNDTPVLHVIDSFDKKFVANYSGFCKRNNNYIAENLSKHRCNNHVISDTVKLYVINHDYTGTCYWKYKNYFQKEFEHNEDPNKSIVCCQLDSNSKKIVEFRTINERNPLEIFQIPYQYLKLHLTNKLTKNEQCKYITKINLCELPSYTKLDQLWLIMYRILNNVTESCDTNLLIKDVLEEYKELRLEKALYHASNINTTITVDDTIPKLTFYDKFHLKKEEIAKFEYLIRNKIIPKYFDSTYGQAYLKEHEPLLEIDVDKDVKMYVDNSISTSHINFDYEMFKDNLPSNDNSNSDSADIISKANEQVDSIKLSRKTNPKKKVSLHFNIQQFPKDYQRPEGKVYQNLENIYKIYTMDKDKMLFSKRRRQRVLEDKRRRLKYKKRSDISTTSNTITSKSDIIINSDAFSYSQSMASLKNNCSIGSLKKNIESVNRNTEDHFNIDTLNVMRDTSKLRSDYPCTDMPLIKAALNYQENLPERHEIILNEFEFSSEDLIDVISRGTMTKF